MYNPESVIQQKIHEIHQQWCLFNPSRISEIEALVLKREKDAKLSILNDLLVTFARRNSMPVLTKDNTTVQWITSKDEHDLRYVVITSGDFKMSLVRVDMLGAHVLIDSKGNYGEISFMNEDKFTYYGNEWHVKPFFIETVFLRELVDQGNEFLLCEECSYTINNCQCCYECGKYECECAYCEYCGELDCHNDCCMDDN